MKSFFKMLPVLSVALILGACAESKPVSTTQLPDGTQMAHIQVKSGYHPDTIEAKAGKPLNLEFFRDEAEGVHSCDQVLLVPSEKIERPLPAQKLEKVLIPAHTAGTEVAFECGMKMMHGKIRFVP
jgi:Cu+-exporting ATPase